MEKRAFERIDFNIQVDVYCDNGIYEGTVRNLSGNGMYIDADAFPPCESNIILVLGQGSIFFKLHGTVKRTVNANESRGIGVELFEPSQKYSEFVSSMII